MKKIVIVIMLVLTFFGRVVYGASSEDLYVRKDVQEGRDRAMIAEIRLQFSELRMEINKKLNEIDKKIDGVKSELHEEIQQVSKKVDMLGSQTENTKTFVYWVLALCGVIGLFAPLLVEIVRIKMKPSFTIEDVKKLIEENNTRMLAMKNVPVA